MNALYRIIISNHSNFVFRFLPLYPSKEELPTLNFKNVRLGSIYEKKKAHFFLVSFCWRGVYTFKGEREIFDAGYLIFVNENLN